MASNPIKVYRGIAADEVVEDDVSEPEVMLSGMPPAEDMDTEQEVLSGLEQAWVDVQADEEATDADKLIALLEWADSEAGSADVQFVKFEFFNTHGLHAQLHLEAASFLKLFPSQREAFMAAAKTWK